MKYKDFKRKVMMEIGEYSDNGAKISDSANNDYMLAITDATNESIKQITTISKNNRKSYDFAQNYPSNLVSGLQTIMHEDVDIVIEVDTAKMYSFEVAGTSIIEIQEFTTIWETIDTINHAYVDGEGYTPYKGKITLTTIGNPVRLVFKGEFYYPIRWIALFKENYEQPIAYNPNKVHQMPDDFYQLDKINLLQSNGLYEEYAINIFNETDNTVMLDYNIKGEFRVNYIAYSNDLEVDENNVNIADEVELDIKPEYIESLINMVAGKLKANTDKKYAVGDRYSGIGIDNLNATISTKTSDNGEDKIVDVWGGW